MSPGSRPLELAVDPKSAVPVYEQIKRAIKMDILSGHLSDGDALMSIRELATKLQVNPNTILKSYYQLEVDGFVVSRPGAGYYVRVDRKKFHQERRHSFVRETAEYLSRITEIGYSVQEAISELERQLEIARSKGG
ncbi:MAG: GntR family transcriptional regulator [Acidobacteria bacterium]|nr:GntR family transcriptional regulator [Acidobacteriota bacterium]